MQHFRTIRTIARASILETVRRKDVYVVLILAGLMMAAGGVFQVLGVKDLDTILRDVSLAVVSLMSTLLCVVLAVRQFPEEIQRRTLYPLLARPISRWHLVIGKYLGAVAMSVSALALLMLIAWANLAMLNIPVGAIIWQYLLLRVMAILVVSALALLLSLLLTPAAALTVTLLVVVGASTFSNTLLLLPPTVPPALLFLLRAAYFALPHIDLFDLRDKVTYSWPPIPGWTVGFLVAYGLFYTSLFLGLAVYRFRRQML